MGKQGFGDIFEYWKDKAITKDGRVITDLGYPGCDEEEFRNLSDTIPVIEDWGEPCCFACNKFLIPQENIKALDLPVKEIWENKGGWINGAEKAHIYPRAKGGNAKESNLFCLCYQCHLESPDTVYPREFFRWVFNRRNAGSVGFQAFTECVNREILPLFSVDDISKANTHGAYMTTQSLVSAMVGAAEERNRWMPKLGEDLDGKTFSLSYKSALSRSQEVVS